MGSFRALAHRDYRLFVAGQLVSLVGTWMQTVAQGWLVYRLSGSPSLLGIVSFAGLAPSFLLSSLGGVVADRLDPRRLALLTQTALLVQATVLGVLTVTGQVRPWHVIVLSVVMGLVNAFDLPARQVLVARVIPKPDLPNAIALNASIFHGSRILGPSLAGLLVAAVGEGWCFLANAVSYLSALAALALMRLQPPEGRPAPRPVLEHLAEGLRYVHGTRSMRRRFGILAAVCLLGMPYTVLMPVVARDVLNAGPRGLGWLMGAGGVGATLAALFLATQKDTARLGRFMLGATALLGVALAAFGASRSFPLSVALIIPVGFCMVAHMTSNNTLVQVEVPDALRGRVMALHATVFMGAVPVGGLVAGLAAERLGAPWTLALLGLGCLLAAGIYALGSATASTTRARA